MATPSGSKADPAKSLESTNTAGPGRPVPNHSAKNASAAPRSYQRPPVPGGQAPRVPPRTKLALPSGPQITGRSILLHLMLQTEHAWQRERKSGQKPNAYSESAPKPVAYGCTSASHGPAAAKPRCAGCCGFGGRAGNEGEPWPPP